jgi:hypothetical protein
MSICGLLASSPLTLKAQNHDGGDGRHTRHHQAFGHGTSLIAPGVLTSFEFDRDEVICTVPNAVMPDGTVMQMVMFSTSVDSFTIDSTAKNVTITGSMVSITKLISPNGTTVTLRETVPYVAFAEDRDDTPQGGPDFFSLTVKFADIPGFNQFALFGSPATFAGTLVTGSVEVR